MSGISKKMLQAAAGSAGGGGGPTVIEDVFSTYLYTGTGAAQTITNGIDLAGEGGLVWIKGRNAVTNHALVDTERGGANSLASDTTDAQRTDGAYGLTFNSDGFDSTGGNLNVSGRDQASWTFRKAPRFFDVVTYTGTGSAQTIAHNLGVEPGCIFVKRTDSARNWAVYHKGADASAPEDYYLFLNGTDARIGPGVTPWNSTAPTDTEFTVGTVSYTNTSGGTYVAYLFAHDPLGPSGDGSDGLISCGSYTKVSGVDVVDLGWEPQWVLLKNASVANGWQIADNMRGWVTGSDTSVLSPNTSAAEGTTGAGLQINANGFQQNDGSIGNTYTYIAIRRGPMRAPESGTEVFQPSYGLNASNSEIVNAGFPIDLNWRENVTGGYNVSLQDRMRGFDNFLSSNNTSAEGGAGGIYSGTQNGIRLAATLNFSSWINWSFRRAPNFFDVVAYTGDGTGLRTHTHNLGVTPEMYIIKKRNTTSPWYVYHNAIPDPNNTYIELNSSGATSASGGVWGGGPTASSFDSVINTSAQTHIAYLFASLAGVSKVGSYTGNGSSQTINCGFTTGARFILIKRTDSAGDWYVWDTARGVITGNDPHLSLNTTAAEVTTDDSIDPDSSGFIVNQLAATNINVSSASYIFLAIA